MVKNNLRGHKIEFLNNQWVYCDTKEPTTETHMDRACGHCGEFSTSEGHDACLGTLPNVMNACCGHGEISDAYLQFWDTTSVRGKDATEFINDIKNNKYHNNKTIKRS